MDQVQQFDGVGTVYRADGSPLEQRRYSITIVPWYEPGKPLAVGSWVELHDREPLEFENEQLTLQLSRDLWFTFRITDVSETPPHQYTFIAEEWPERRAGYPGRAAGIELHPLQAD
jgi:hypothetical protein